MTSPIQIGEAEMTPAGARELTDRIKAAVEDVWQLIQQAYVSRAWATLGYETWDAYCSAEFGTSRVRLPREERQEVVASLRESGLSTRAIASATGMHHSTIADDLRGVGNPTPEPAPVTGMDGKSYAPTRPNPEPAEDERRHVQQQRRKPPTSIPKTVMRALGDIDRARRSLTALNMGQLAQQDEEARRIWAANLSEQLEALTRFRDILR